VGTTAIVLLEGLGQLKNPMNTSGIEPAIFRRVHNASINYATSGNSEENNSKLHRPESDNQ
jgi:hypothetical protein